MILSTMSTDISFDSDQIDIAYYFYTHHQFILYTPDYKVICEPAISTMENNIVVDIQIDFNLNTEPDLKMSYPESISFEHVDHVNITRRHAVTGLPQIGLVLTKTQPYVIYPKVVVKDRVLVVEFAGEWTDLYNVL